MRPSLELGSPLLADPSDTMSMSPLPSQPPTPPTPLTGLTIPSPGSDESKGVAEDNTGVSNDNTSPLEPVDADDQIEEVIPANIPLPPSPRSTKQSLPFRRPRVSNPLERITSSPTSRTTPGRRVSSALQYAMRPQSESPAQQDRDVSTGIIDFDLDLAHYEEMRNSIPGSDTDSESEVQEIRWDSTLGFGGQVPDLIGEGVEGLGGEEEAWMGYVRQQLNTLFPDYFDESFEAVEGGERSMSSISSNELSTPPLALGRGVPNVRQEIGGLRDEIERLRDVVSGLAEGIRATLPATGAHEMQADSSIAVIHEAGENETTSMADTSLGPIPEEFLKTAHISMEIIRILHTALGGVACPDSNLFSQGNLISIKQYFEALQERQQLSSNT